MLKTKTFAIIFGASWVGLIAIGIAGTAVVERFLASDPMAMQRIGVYMRDVAFALFVAQSFCLLPLMLRLFISVQIKMGNGERALVKLLKQNERVIIYSFWVIWSIGLIVALVTMRGAGG